MTEPLIRLTRESDLPAYSEIVNHYIETTSINFRTEPQSAAEWTADWKRLRESHPWLVALEPDGTVAGLAYATPWRPRPAYDWTVETTVYVRAGRHGRGIGRAVYSRLLDLLDKQGFHSQIGVVALPNVGSVALHEAVGFRYVGVLEEVGQKQGGWRDTGLWQRRIAVGGFDSVPTRPLPVSLVAGQELSG